MERFSVGVVPFLLVSLISLPLFFVALILDVRDVCLELLDFDDQVLELFRFTITHPCRFKCVKEVSGGGQLLVLGCEPSLMSPLKSLLLYRLRVCSRLDIVAGSEEGLCLYRSS